MSGVTEEVERGIVYSSAVRNIYKKTESSILLLIGTINYLLGGTRVEAAVI
jgi:hypothetical protein